MNRRRFVISVAGTLLAATSSAAPRPRIAIIIDDLGYHFSAGRRALELPGPVAYSVLPQTPYGRRLAQLANAAGREVLLHLPLEAANHEGPPDPGSIMLDMTRGALRTTFASAIETVPFAIGVSSHRGSLLTRHPGHMAWLMKEIREREDLFFIDSYTTHESIALARLRISASTKNRLLLTICCNPRCRVASSQPIHRSRTFIRQAGDENCTHPTTSRRGRPAYTRY